jgi:hypothetical protein
MNSLCASVSCLQKDQEDRSGLCITYVQLSIPVLARSFRTLTRYFKLATACYLQYLENVYPQVQHRSVSSILMPNIDFQFRVELSLACEFVKLTSTSMPVEEGLDQRTNVFSMLGLECSCICSDTLRVHEYLTSPFYVPCGRSHLPLSWLDPMIQKARTGAKEAACADALNTT